MIRKSDSSKIILINPPSWCVDDDRLEPPLGLLYLGSALREGGFHGIELCDMSGCVSQEEAIIKIKHTPQAPIYGITCLCTNYPYVKRIVSRIKKTNPNAYVVLGGPNPTAMPDFTLNDSGADAVVKGEGEEAFINCVRSRIAGAPIQGVIAGTLREEINAYPFPARDLAAPHSYTRELEKTPVVSMVSSRGCPHRCLYCNSVVMGGGAPKVRFRSPENVIQEIASLPEPIHGIRFNDDCFTANPDLFKLLNRLSPLDLTFRIFARIEDLTPKTCQALRDAGCVHVAVGLESLDPRNLKIIGKAGQIGCEANVKAAKEAGLIVRAYFMVGLPYDTDDAIKRSFTRAARLGVHEFSVYSMIPYPGTRIAETPEKYGYAILNKNFTDYVQIGFQGESCYVLKHKNFNPEDVKRWKREAEEILMQGGASHSRNSAVAT